MKIKFNVKIKKNSELKFLNLLFTLDDSYLKLKNQNISSNFYKFKKKKK